ncbi:MAG: hypothetical protein GC146_11895 [Limimaricola sp.]|uniref:hypothetical protein n=1 Tax=Limimaricola sp. TaxID=2211665 RepID=UPI001D9E14A5|nr:hypothetical protein [Limimaricola sp.]MBI1417916.1 hypothetical protein [Limimaricola sp.]
MNRYKASTAILALMLATPAMADPAFMVGFAFNFAGGKPVSSGITAKVLSSNEPDKFVGAAGVSYFFDHGGYIGVDAGFGYLFEQNFATTLTYDFLNNRPQFSLGYSTVC